ncbi:MAG: methyltransferase [Candidatus Aenigmatarchaeota archaeon]
MKEVEARKEIEKEEKSDIEIFDESTNKFYKLIYTKTWPTVQISGIQMHRIEGCDPKRDTILKLRALGKIYGRVLDTCCGLGYTSILTARKKGVKEVFTFEKDKNIIKIARMNEFSKELFENAKIKLSIGDIFIEIKKFPKEFFNIIIHDPPTYSLAPELYSKEFYKELFRVLKWNGKIFHYIGNFRSNRARRILKGVLKRLREAGFYKIKKVKSAHGLLIIKF